MKTKIIYMFLICFQLANAQVQPAIQLQPTLTLNPAILKFINQPNGYHCFDLFEPNASGFSAKNAYLLMLCSNYIFPDQIEDYEGKDDGKDISSAQYNDENLFKRTFESKFKDFGMTKFTYFSATKFGTSIQGYVMSNDNAIIVIFRGTETHESPGIIIDICRQCTALSSICPMCSIPDTKVPVPTDVITDGTAFEKKVTEWGTLPGAETPGVHVGFYTAYKSAQAAILSAIAAHGGNSKKIWVTGHSYGGALATIAALDLTVHNLKPQGIYTYANPREGNVLFKELYDSKNINHIRFVNQNDIVPMAPGDDIVTTTALATPEYSKIYGLKKEFAHVGRIYNLRSDGTIVSNDKEFKGFGDIARHSTLEYLYYIYYAYIRNQSYASQMFEPPLPSKNFKPIAVSAPSSSSNSTDNILWEAGSIISNLTGNAIPEGDYIFRCYSQRDHPTHGMSYTWDDKNNSDAKHPAQLIIEWIGNPGNNIFHVSHDLLGGGYRVSMKVKAIKRDLFGNIERDGDGDVQKETKDFYMEVPGTSSLANNAPAQMQEYHVYDGQIWMFYQIPNQSGYYVIKNKLGGLTGKVLDADDKCFTEGECDVKQYQTLKNDQSQIWVLEKQ